MDQMEDARFAHISSDPRFRATPKSIKKIKIDKRFQSLFTDKRFQLKYSVDKRGRPVDQSSNENFRKYYDISSDEETSSESDIGIKSDGLKSSNDLNLQIQQKKKSKVSSLKNYSGNSHKNVAKTNDWVISPSGQRSSDNTESLEVENEKNVMDDSSKTVNEKFTKSNNLNIKISSSDLIDKARMTDEVKLKLKDPNIDYARGMGVLLSDSSSEESSSDSESEEGEVEHRWGELDRDAETTEDTTDRLAVLHMDWDRIRAVDLMVLFNSFLPPEGVIKSVTIYPSEFGLIRMKEEEEKGPIELTNMKIKNEEDLNEENKDGKLFHMERLRQYQLNRLKYYYAVIQFDSVETADKVYSECDNLEYESSATKLDLRFIPADETFDQEPHEMCTSMPDPAKYKPRIFTNSALQQGKVELTWDETDPTRQELTRKIQKNADVVDNSDLQAYLAYSSEEDISEQEKSNKDDSESEGEDVKEEDKIEKYKSLLASLEEEEEKKKQRNVDLEITWGVGLKEKAEKAIKEKLNTPKTPFEEMLKKRNEKKKLKKEEKLKQNKTNNDSGSNLSSDDDVPSDIDLNDPYFKEEFQGTKPMKKSKKVVDEEESNEVKQKKAELELLLLDENDTELQKSHFNMKKIQDQESDIKKKKKKGRKQLKKKPQKEIPPEKDDFEVDVADDRFNALFTSHHFNIDPSDPHYHKTKAMETIFSEKLKRRKQDQIKQEFSSTKQRKIDPELSLLVSSIKNKTKQKL